MSGSTELIRLTIGRVFATISNEAGVRGSTTQWSLSEEILFLKERHTMSFKANESAGEG